MVCIIKHLILRSGKVNLRVVYHNIGRTIRSSRLVYLDEGLLADIYRLADDE